MILLEDIAIAGSYISESLLAGGGETEFSSVRVKGVFILLLVIGIIHELVVADTELRSCRGILEHIVSEAGVHEASLLGRLVISGGSN